MRILAFAFMAGSALVAASSFTSDETSDRVATQQTRFTAPHGLDPIITGQTLSKENIAEWEAQRKLYLECPNCEAGQPFPDDVEQAGGSGLSQ